MEFEHKLEAFGIYGWVAQFRLKPDTNRSLWQKIKDKIKLTYAWYPYIEFREDLHLSGYDRWGTDLKFFDTPKMAKDYYMKHIDGFAHNDNIYKMVKDKYEGNT